MEVILKETIDTLGEEGEILKVKSGYGRNYLIPQKKAVLATDANKAMLAQEIDAINSRRERQKGEANELGKKIASVTVVIEQRVGEENKLYGSVTSADIAEKLAALGIEIDKRKIMLDEPIRTLGETMVPVKVGYQMTSDIKVEIVPLTVQ